MLDFFDGSSIWRLFFLFSMINSVIHDHFIKEIYDRRSLVWPLRDHEVVYVVRNRAEAKTINITKFFQKIETSRMPKIPRIVLFGLCITAHFGILQKKGRASLRTSQTALCRQNTGAGAAFQRCTQMLRSTSTSVKRHTLKSFCGFMAVAQFERSLALSALPRILDNA